MKLDQETFKLTKELKNPVTIVNVSNTNTINEILKYTFNTHTKPKTLLILTSTTVLSAVRQNQEYYLFASGMVTQNIRNKCKIENIKEETSIAFNEEKIKEILHIPGFMKIICLISIDDKIESNLNFIQNENWNKQI